ncbi:hypothetical protein Poli38472_010669 [Pythium oligandrum]|uniref:Amidohydrolase 3 domain-containing protein n=1 Tax=Pythium oligandrum TaxID=41045 RepID=A0A8K1FDN8_PYTOL|nr:hypothetical protein Poli38472_010669 [Pythium oligandrum]|eukprot:TMW55787.1 hypothetical protein Poli38472_010669 [Pythium oligandrum]
MATLFTNGKIWQWTGEYAAWMHVDADGTIKQVGAQETPIPADPTAQVVDLDGALVLPGLHDSHIHAYYMGESAEFLNLSGCSSFEDFNERLRQYDAKYPDKSWVVGFGWEQDTLSASARYPSRHDIDAVVRDRPVLLHRACWHIAAVNTKALEIAGVDITKKTHDLASGTIDVDEQGATGILREAAVELVTKHTNEESDAVRIKYLRHSLEKCVSHGLTGIHTNDHNAWHLYSQIQQESGLPLRVYLTPLIDELKNPSTPKPGSKVGLLSCDRMKIFSDGSLGAETAALRTPYLGTSNTGILMDTNEALIKKVSDAHKDGYRLEIHAIGDRAAEQVLMALKEADVPPEKRPIMTHCQILGDDLLTQMQTQGVIGNIQPSFTITDAAFARKRLPESMIKYSYCWKTMMQRGIVCAGGSDAPIETCNPFQGMYDAIYRAKPTEPDQVFLPEECLTFEEALEIYTKNGTFAAMADHQLGQLKPGYLADFVVLRRDVTQDHKAMLDSDLVHSVWVNGKKTYAYDPQRAANASATDFSQSSLPGKNGQIRICRCCRR